MKNKLIKLTETDLHTIIKECTNKVLKEGTISTETNEMWNQAEEVMGAESMLDALYTYLDSDVIEDFIQTLVNEYDIPLGQY